MNDNDKNSPIVQITKCEESTDYCYFEDKKYSPGSIICMAGTLYECGYGRWSSLHKDCQGGMVEKDKIN